MTLIVSFDGLSINDGSSYTATFDYSYGLPASQPVLVERTNTDALVGNVRRPGHRLPNLLIQIEDNANKETLRNNLQAKFDPRNGSARNLVIKDDDGTDERFIQCVVQAFDQAPQSAGTRFVATLVAYDEVRFRSTLQSTDSWSVTATGQQKTINNAGDADAYPVITITPTSQKSAGNIYRRKATVDWTTARGATNYPVDITNGGWDTATLVTAGKMQADGDDIRVYVNGEEVDYWLQGINTASTKIWINLDFKPFVSQGDLTVGEAIPGSGELDYIQVAEDISALPSSGFLICQSGEYFHYGSKNNFLRRFEDITRGVWGSSFGSAIVGLYLNWIQHDIWITYGDGSAAAYAADDDNKPWFVLTSTNDIWTFEHFGLYFPTPHPILPWWKFNPPLVFGLNGDRLRPIAERDASVDAIETLIMSARGGESTDAPSLIRGDGQIEFHHVLGLNKMDVTAGEIYDADISSPSPLGVFLRSQNGVDWEETGSTISQPSTSTTWESWTQTYTVIVSYEVVAIAVKPYRVPESQNRLVKLDTVAMTIRRSGKLAVNLDTVNERANYPLDLTLENTTTGESIQIKVPMDLNETLTIDTADKTITYSEDGASKFPAFDLVEGPRREWLRLAPGDNVLQYNEANVAGVSVGIEWRHRYYD